MDAPLDRQTCWQDCDRLGVDAVRARLLDDERRAGDHAWRMHARDWMQQQLLRQARATYRMVLLAIAGTALAIALLVVM